MMNSFNVVMILVVIVFVQAITSMVHIKYYQKKIRATVDKYNNGFLGVGTTKKFLKVGKIAILVIDKEGIILECNILSGLIVFSRFHNYQEYVGEHIDSINWEEKKHQSVVKDALIRVREQMNKTVNTTP